MARQEEAPKLGFKMSPVVLNRGSKNHHFQKIIVKSGWATPRLSPQRDWRINVQHTRNLTGKTGGISKLEYFVEALKAPVEPIMNNQTLCLHFAQRWASKMHHCLQWLDSTVSNWNKGQSLDFGIACYCPTTVYWAYHLKINAFIGTWWLNQV